MKRRLRILFLVLGIAFVLLLSLPFLIPAERWKSLAIEQLETRTGWRAEAVDARISIFPLGLRLAGIAIEDPDGDATLERFIVRADGVILRADLASVLRRNPNLQEIRFQKPEIEVWTRKTQSRASAVTPGEVVAPSSPPTGAASPGVSGLLAFVALEQGSLVIHDAEQTVALHGIDQQAELRLEGQRYTLSLAGALAGGSVEATTLPKGRIEIPALELEALAEGRLPAEKIDLSSWTLRAIGQEIRGDAQIVLVPSPAASFHATVDGNVEALHAALVAEFPPLPPLARGYELSGGELRVEVASVRAIDFAADADRIPALITANGSVRALEVRHLGEILRCAEATLTVEDGKFALRDARLSLPGLDATLNAETTLAPQSEMSTDAKLRGDLRALRALAARVMPKLPEEMRAGAPPSEQWPGAAGLVEGTLRATLPAQPVEDPTQLDLELRLDLAGAAVLLPAWRDSVKLARGELVAGATHADLRGIRISGPGFVGTATGQAWGWPDGIESEWDVAFERVDLDQLQAATTPPAAEKAALPSWLQGTAHAASAPELAVPPANLGADLRLSAKEVHSRGYRLTDVRGRASLHQQKLHLGDTQARFAGGEVDLQGEVDWTQDPPKWQGNSKARSIAASELLRPFAAPLADAISANFSGEFSLDGPVSAQTAVVLAALSGEFSVNSESGSLLTEPILGDALSGFLGSHYARFQKLDFRSLTAGLEVKTGAVHFDRFVLDGATELRVSGLVGLDGQCDYGIEIRLPRGTSPQVGELQPLVDLLEDEEGRISFHVDVEGPAKKPKVQVDMAALGERMRLGAEAKAKGELEKLIEEKGKETVGGLLDRLKKKKGGGG